MQSDDHPARDGQNPAAHITAPARRGRAVVDFRPYPTAPTRTRRSPANSGRRDTRRGNQPTPSTVWFTPTRHEAAPGADVVPDPARLSRLGGAPDIEPAGVVWPLAVLARAVTSFTEPGATVLLLPWPAAARDGLAEAVPSGAVAAVAELGRRPRLGDLPAAAGRNDNAVQLRSDEADGRVDLLITVMPAWLDAAEHTDVVARHAARALRLGGVLAVLTQGRRDGLPADGLPTFSRKKIRHCVESRSWGRRARAPPRRQAVSTCSRRSRVSRPGSLPVVAAIWLISASRLSATARRVEGRRRGLDTLRAGLSAGLIRPSCSACR